MASATPNLGQLGNILLSGLREIMNSSSLNIQEISIQENVSSSTVRRWLKSGLDHYKIGNTIRIKHDDLERFKNHFKREYALSEKLFINALTNLSPVVIGIDEGGQGAMAKAKKKRHNCGFGSVYIRETKRGRPRYYADYRDRQGKRIQRLIKNATNWQEALEGLKNAVLREHYRECGVEEEKQPIKLKEFTELFIENYSKVNKQSWKDDQERLQWINGLFGDVALNEISPIHIEKLKSRKLKEGVTRTTVNHYLKTLKRMFNIAIAWGYTDKNPVKGIKFYSEKDAQRDRVLTREEEDRLLGVASERLRPILIVALNTGMRKGEILRLKWQDIDLENRIILVKQTKSGKPRTLPINSRLLDELMWLKKRNRKSQCLFTNSKTGGPLKTIRRSFDAACRDAKLQNFRFHDLRRTFGSRLALAGVDLNRIKELLGHASLKTTEIYLHAELKDIREAVEVLCQNTPKSGKKRGDLLHSRYTKKDDQEFHPVSSLFSVN